MSEQLGLWMEAPPRPSKRGKRWGGRDSERARAHCRAMLPAPCQRCGGIITLEDDESTWHAGHIIDRADGGGTSPEDTVPEHARCNTRAGGKRGAAMVNARHAADDPGRERTTRWW